MPRAPETIHTLAVWPAPPADRPDGLRCRRFGDTPGAPSPAVSRSHAIVDRVNGEMNLGIRVLRDYLYVDVDKVKSIAGQLDSGVPEESRLTKRDATRTTMGWKAFLAYSPESSEEGYVQRSMLDSLFPELEEVLEQGWLQDISEEYARDHDDPVEFFRDVRPEGSIFRLTADGYLFDVRHFANLFANFSITLNGFQDFEKAVAELARSMATQAAGAPPKKPPPQKKQPRTPDAENVEDAIEDFAPQHGMSSGLLRAMVHAARGAFTPGLQLVMASGTSETALTVSTRLDDTGRYLVSSPELVASRFGFKPQRWTIVGTVGHYSEPPEEAAAASATNQLETELADGFSRTRFVRSINDMVRNMAHSGLVDLPQHPGMAAIPIAVYRAVEGGPALVDVTPIERGADHD